jgi:chorismate mutase
VKDANSNIIKDRDRLEKVIEDLREQIENLGDNSNS